MLHVAWIDLVNILVLVGLEGVLSADNALVLAVMVRRLSRKDEQRKALRYGMIGAFILRGIVTVFAIKLAKMEAAGLVIALLGGLYLLYLPGKHFFGREKEHSNAEAAASPRNWLGLNAFWATVVAVELTDLVFAVDSILVAIAITKVVWVIVVGGILGIIMMRLLTVQVLALVERYPRLIDGAYVIVGWVGIKLMLEFFHKLHWIPFELDTKVSLAVVIALFVAAYLYARAYPAETASSLSEELIGDDPQATEDV